MKKNGQNILFLLENTADYPAGGTEISSRTLAVLLKKRGMTVTEWSPFRKRKSPFWYTALFLLPILIQKILLVSQKKNIQLIHVQGKYLVPAGVVAAKLLKIPVVVTIRDYIVCCPIGLCVMNREHRHGFWRFISNEIPEFFQTYHRRDNLVIRIVKLILLVRGWFTTQWMRWWVQRTDAVITVSAAVQQILRDFSISSVVIFNPFDPAIVQRILKLKEESPIVQDTILFVGKPSYGKGFDLFQKLSRRPEFQKFHFQAIGSGGWVAYEETLREMHNALVTVAPSRWQEPFGRVALESIMMGTPVVATRRGGLPEIVEDGKTGAFADPTTSSLTHALRTAILNNKQLRYTLRKSQRSLIKTFSTQPTKQHLALYRELLGNIRDR